MDNPVVIALTTLEQRRQIEKATGKELNLKDYIGFNIITWCKGREVCTEIGEVSVDGFSIIDIFGYTYPASLVLINDSRLYKIIGHPKKTSAMLADEDLLNKISSYPCKKE
jgi:hypothetical protein